MEIGTEMMEEVSLAKGIACGDGVLMLDSCFRRNDQRTMEW